MLVHLTLLLEHLALLLVEELLNMLKLGKVLFLILLNEHL